MMKKLLFAMLLPATMVAQDKFDLSEFESTSNGTEQAFIYNFTQYSSAYQDVVNPDFAVNAVWDDTTLIIENPFGKSYAGVMQDTMITDLGAYLLGISPSFSSTDAFILAPTTADLIDRGYNTNMAMSPISYVTEGTAPNRIFKMEWKNAGIYEEVIWNGTNNVSLNVQIWLHENGDVEFHYGPNTITQDWVDTLFMYEEMTIGLAGIDLINDNIEDGHFLTGTAANATMVDTLTQLSTWPTNGTVYKFALPSVGINEIQTLEVKLYPNPAVNELRINAEAGEVYDVALIDLSGRTVKRGQLTSDSSMDLMGTPAGVYLVRLKESVSGITQTVRLVVTQ
ncbi:MAG: T9SS type A sorting domain-containing protein [Flavobacteriia bacterium]|nr:T9SS type A sorting domain-containing protein [Flavobacteriia bacterium]